MVMARSVFVASVEGHTAKSVVALGLIRALQGNNLKVGVFRSITPDQENDHVLRLLLSQISSSKVPVLVIPTNEELEIAMQAKSALGEK